MISFFDIRKKELNQKENKGGHDGGRRGSFGGLASRVHPQGTRLDETLPLAILA